MRSGMLIALTLGLPACLVGSVSGATISFTPAADTPIRNDNAGSNATVNYGTGNQLLLGSNTGVLESLVRFSDFTAIGLTTGQTVTVGSVTLSLTSGSAGNTGTLIANLNDYAINFGEATATYNNPAGNGTDTTAGGTAGTLLSTATSTSAAAGVTLTFPTSSAFVSDVQTAINSGGTLNYLLTSNASPATTNFVRFNSKEATGLGALPTLTVNYNVVPEPASIGLAMFGVGMLALNRRRRQPVR